MHLKVLLPFRTFIDAINVTHIVVQTNEGAFGMLTQRLDCAAPLTPGILTYSTAEVGEIYIGVDEGVMVKTGTDVLVSVRSAVISEDLSELRRVIEKDFLLMDQQAQQVRAIMTKLENGFLHRFADFQKIP